VHLEQAAPTCLALFGEVLQETQWCVLPSFPFGPYSLVRIQSSMRLRDLSGFIAGCGAQINRKLHRVSPNRGPSSQSSHCAGSRNFGQPCKLQLIVRQVRGAQANSLTEALVARRLHPQSGQPWAVKSFSCSPLYFMIMSHP
jgi:hypothetical protein